MSRDEKRIEKAAVLRCDACPDDMAKAVLARYDIKWIKPRGYGAPPDDGAVRALAVPEICNEYIARIHPSTGAPGDLVTVVIVHSVLEDPVVSFGGVAASAAPPVAPGTPGTPETPMAATASPALAAGADQRQPGVAPASLVASTESAALVVSTASAEDSAESVQPLEPAAEPEKETSIRVLVPADLTPGVVNIRVTGGKQPIMAFKAFVIMPPAPAPAPAAAAAAAAAAAGAGAGAADDAPDAVAGPTSAAVLDALLV